MKKLLLVFLALLPLFACGPGEDGDSSDTQNIIINTGDPALENGGSVAGDDNRTVDEENVGGENNSLRDESGEGD